AAQYNMFEIGGERGNWRLRLTRRGLTGPAMPPSDLQSMDLDVPADGRQLVRS
ncbi:MAG: metallophosphoesterase, partial [Mesorhizobium sp.]